MIGQKLTKIVATIGPASESEVVLSKLIDAGVNVFRFNTKHSTPEWHDEHIRLIQSIADKKGVTIGIFLDLQGPEIRLETKDAKDIHVRTGEEIKIGLSFDQGVNLIIPHASVFKLMSVGDDLFIDDGFVETKVVSVSESELVVSVENDSVIKHRKGVNVPGKDVDFPSLIESDILQLDKNATNKVDYVGLSFVRSAGDIKILRHEMEKRGMHAMIVAKIESQPALDRLDEIIKEADAVMVARGDLGVEVPFEQLAYWQRTIITKCRVLGKPVITATQMLESMIVNPRPTRAEVTDIAHAIFDGTDAIMLSGETAGGKYPVKVVTTMSKIAKWNETFERKRLNFDEATDHTSTIASAVVSIVNSNTKPKIDYVLVFTETGYTARAISKHRLHIPVVAITDNRKTAETLTISYGVNSFVADLPSGRFASVDGLLNAFLKKEILKKGHTIVVVHGHHWQKPGNTNSLSIITL